MAELEQTARYALKIQPAEPLQWMLPDLDPDQALTRWLDTQTIAFPGEPDRGCDTVAELVSRLGKSPPWALVLGVEARSRSTILARVLEYRARLLRKLRHGPHRRDRYLVAAVVVFRQRKTQRPAPGGTATRRPMWVTMTECGQSVWLSSKRLKSWNASVEENWAGVFRPGCR